MQHLEEGTIHAWLDGALPPDEAAAVEAHARTCATCAAAVAEARGMIAGAARIVSALDIARGGVVPSVPSVPAVRAPHPTSGNSLWRRLHLSPGRAALAATILVALSGTLVVRHQRSLGDAIDQGRLIDSPPIGASISQSVRPDSTPAAPAPKPQLPIEHTTTALPLRKTAEPGNRPQLHTQAKAQAQAPTPAPSPAPAPSAGAAAASVNVDTVTRPPAATAKAAERANFAATAVTGARAVARNGRLDEAVMTSAPGIVGCYQLTSQPADSTFGSLPNRFALERGGAASPQNIVRSVSPDGRIDTVIAGTTWRQAAPNQVSIVFANDGVVNRTVELELGLARATSRSASGANSTLPIRRLDCVR
ncbi:MAG TPA: zf-HC2 domain-containing protein [Gemmatimonadaceae bacterium]|nr:zf-HC2 domain-containing protein [Gemmatimonadaceae bacterium]